MKQKQKFGIGVVAVAILIAIITWYLHRHTIAVLQPAGTIAHSERNIIIFASALSLAVVIPVFALLGIFAYKYRETNTKAKYSPELDGSKLAETIWWIIPTLLISILAIVTWRTSYSLDPYKPIVSKNPTLHVQVVAMDWKWLFIYPQQHIASVNQLEIPTNTPVQFDLTSDSVMNSFWIPQLGGQMYAMPGMNTQLNLMATQEGIFTGRSANISGKGFADMHFPTQAVSPGAFDEWTRTISTSADSGDDSIKPKLDSQAYSLLARPSENNAASSYASIDSNIYNSIIEKYMSPLSSMSGTMSGMSSESSMDGMSM